MSFTQSATYNDLPAPDATYKLQDVNAHHGAVNPRAHFELVTYPNQASKDAEINALFVRSWDLQADAQYDPETGAMIAPAFDSIFGQDGDGNALDPRRQMYLFIRSLPEYADAVDLLP